MDDHNETLTIKITSAPNHGRKTLADTLERLLVANNIPAVRTDVGEETTLEIDTAPGIHQLRAYSLAPNPYTQSECVDPATGQYRAPASKGDL